VTPAPVPAAPAAQGSWQTPDYASIIGGDWELAQAGAEGQKSIGEAENSFQQALRRAFIDYGGGDPSKLGEWAKYIDAPTIEAAKQNRMSAIAQNLASMNKALRRQRASLAARGMLSSGQTTADTQEALKAREAGDYGALRGFLSGAEQGMGGLNSVRQQIADRIAQARGNAAARAQEQYQPTWVPGESAAPTPAPSQPWGGISWGGVNGITTKAQLQKVLNVPYAVWAKNHPAAAARLK
jgi:hypothetical protein